MAFAQSEEKTQYTRKYDVFNNMADRTTIKIFDAKYPHNNFMRILFEMGLARKTEQSPDGVIDGSRITEVNDVMDKLKACNDLLKLEDYGKKQESLKFESLYKQINITA